MRVLKIIDFASEHVGSWARWLALGLVLVGVFDTVMRYAFNAPTVWAYETSMMMGGSIYAFGWAYDYLHKSHVRVDILYTHLSTRGKAIMDVVCSTLFFFPLMVVLLKTSVFWAMRAWARHEVMMESYWYPPAAPFRTVIVIGIALLLLQGIVQFVRDVNLVMGRKP